MIDKLLEESKTGMQQSVERLKGELGKLRTGRASLAMLDGLKIDQYGTPTPLAQVSALGIPDSSTITIQPWDTSLIKPIEKALHSSTLELNPVNDGKVIRLNIPPLTGERRRQLVKTLKHYVEESKVTIRKVRRDSNHKIGHLEKESIPKDDCRKGQENLQKVTDRYIAEVDTIAQTAEKNIMDV